jgi:hypothetical protein
MLNNAIRLLLGIFFFLFQFIWKEIKKLQFVSRGNKELGIQAISRSDRWEDILAVFKPTRVFMLFNLLALFVFLRLPQGQDVLLIVIEDMRNYHFWPFFSLIFGIVGWSVVAEFGARYRIYVTDNSGFILNTERIEYRKQLQRFFSMVYLMLPFWIVIIGTAIVTFSNLPSYRLVDAWPFLLVFFGLAIVLKGVTQFYNSEGIFRKIGNTNIGGFFKLKHEERDWLERLYGIYSDYVLRIRTSTSYINNPANRNIQSNYAAFISEMKRQPVSSADTIDNGFPNAFAPREELPPTPFGFPQYHDREFRFDPIEVNWKENMVGFHRWIYVNNPKFYKTLHLQVKAIFAGSLVMILLLAFEFPLPANFVEAPGLVCLAFGCWQGVYTGLLYLDKRFSRQTWFSFRWGLIIWMLVCSYYNNDHPVRRADDRGNDQRVLLREHFTKWLEDRQRISDTLLLNDKLPRRVPVIFVTAEGGALRTGAFTALLLSAFQDSFRTFRDHIYAFSTVSGGTVGVSFFNAVNYLDVDCSARFEKGYYTKRTKDFFRQDFLSPVLAKMFYGEAFNVCSFWDIASFDRGIALEKAWEQGYASIFNGNNDRNIFGEGFLSYYQKQDSMPYPAWFINTTEVETGRQCYLSTVRADSFQFGVDRDLLVHKVSADINYSTAVNFSTRFPFVSPSAAVAQDAKVRHYVDGGYIENTGSKTMLEMLRLLFKDTTLKHQIVPYVLQLRFGEKDVFKSTGFLNELNSIFSGWYNTRSGILNASVDDLKHFVENDLRGKFIPVGLDATTTEVPLNWVLSDRSLDTLAQRVNILFKDSTNQLHRDLYWFHPDQYKYNDSTDRRCR